MTDRLPAVLEALDSSADTALNRVSGTQQRLRWPDMVFCQ